jgi:hypothetical protein
MTQPYIWSRNQKWLGRRSAWSLHALERLDVVWSKIFSLLWRSTPADLEEWGERASVMMLTL